MKPQSLSTEKSRSLGLAGGGMTSSFTTCFTGVREGAPFTRAFFSQDLLSPASAMLCSEVDRDWTPESSELREQLYNRR
ncbi:hypothetical protein JZ751_026674 [Albula glossodonta]|uniref:Uncharacterized protein n=1 Tax=Albula glossodonta TaxID=121402 RepID=A0A8T2PE29_9TELE|nr:hypothetical protein JZ751_026674 [Albula glossodonta]